MAPKKDNINLEVLKMVIKSGSILQQIGEHHPNIKYQLYLDLEAALKMLKAKNCLHLFRVQHNFKVPYDGNHPQKAWATYKDIIRANIAMLCQKLVTETNTTFLEYFCPAKDVLASIIHKKYYDVLPCWPKVNQTNEAIIDLDIKSSYIYGLYYVIWSCLGTLEVKDERPSEDCFRACFTGCPDIKCLVLDKVALDAVERNLRTLSTEKQREAIEKYKEMGEIQWSDLTERN